MFKHVLLCYDGSQSGRRALRRGAELAIFLHAKVHLLSIVPTGASSASVLAGAAGHACIVDEDRGYRNMLEESLVRLKARGVEAEGHLARGNTVDVILDFTKRLGIDLIVLGHYPQPAGGFWWTSSNRASLAEQAHCCVFVAMDTSDTAEQNASR